jgi:hypothetical protein
VSDSSFDHHRKDINFFVTVKPGFAMWHETGIGQIHEVANTFPGTMFRPAFKYAVVHHHSRFLQSAEAATLKVISM